MNGSESVARPPPQYIRRPHRKTKTGCLQCRKRKVKCDERKPFCSHCLRHSTECSFNAASDGVDYADSTTPTSAKNSPGPDPVAQIASCSTTTWGDLELIHHFTVSTALTLSQGVEQEKMWQVLVPQLAIQHPFLMRGIFAISALHLARLRPDQSEKYLVAAANHENFALPAYRSLLSEINKDNCHAAFAFSSLILAYSLASPYLSRGLFFAGPDLSGAEPQWLHLVRGTYHILESTRSWLDKGPMIQLLQGSTTKSSSSFQKTDNEKLDLLLPLIESISKLGLLAQTQKQIYLEAFHELQTTFEFSYPPEPSRYCRKLSFLRWAVRISDDFIVLLSRREPLALVLLAHLCILLKREEPCWFMDGNAERLIVAIKEILVEEWLLYIQWPLDEVQS